MEKKNWFNQTANETRDFFQTDFEKGLTSAQVEENEKIFEKALFVGIYAGHAGWFAAGRRLWL